MKNKTLWTRIFGITAALIMALSFSTCGGDGDDNSGSSNNHTHNWSDWKSNSTQHWKECSCGVKNEEANHTPDDDQICLICEYSMGTIIALDQPVFVKAYTITHNSISIRWNNVAKATKYIIYISETETGTYIEKGEKYSYDGALEGSRDYEEDNFTNTGDSYTILDLNENTIYWIKIKAFDDKNYQSPFSAIFNTKTLINPSQSTSILTKINITNLPNGFQNQPFIIKGNGFPGNYDGLWSWNESVIRAIVSNSGVFDYTFDPPHPMNQDFNFTGVVVPDQENAVVVEWIYRIPQDTIIVYPKDDGNYILKGVWANFPSAWKWEFILDN